MSTFTNEKRPTDIVNAFFKQFYPADWRDESRYDFTTSLGGMRGYQGEADNVFPPIECNDGFVVSVQGHRGAYSIPRDDFAEEYEAVECSFPSAREELLMPYIDGDEATEDPLQSVYGYVQIRVVVAVIEKHGGLKGAFEIGPQP